MGSRDKLHETLITLKEEVEDQIKALSTEVESMKEMLVERGKQKLQEADPDKKNEIGKEMDTLALWLLEKEQDVEKARSRACKYELTLHEKERDSKAMREFERGRDLASLA